MRRLFVARQFESRWIPASARIPSHRQKLMIVLHGLGDSLDSFADIRTELGLPEMNYLLLNAPKPFEDGYSWYALEPRHASDVRRSRRLLTALVADLKREGWAQEDIFWLGHSQGALMVCDQLMNHAGRFGGAVGISGYVWFFRGWKTRARNSAAWLTPWLMTYGLRDRLIPPSEIREDLEKLWSAGAPVVARAFAKGHDFDFKNEVPFVREWLHFLYAPTRASVAPRFSYIRGDVSAPSMLK
ncbi:MAG: serine esterase [Bdellovibrionaceae bacterium]|nr:serine esterase [Pseudobdellovibrionaceae bacterium]